MLQYQFIYNLPSDNSKFGCSDTMINVTAYLPTPNQIHLEFDKLGAGTLLGVISWHKAVEDMQELARTEFQMMQNIKHIQHAA